MLRVTRVLCIHEDGLQLNTRKTVLENAGFNVRWSGTGADGMLQFRTFRPDIAVLDYELPDVSGDIIASGMKFIAPRIPLLMFAPHIFLPASAIVAVDGWLVKGDSPELLLSKINELLGNTNAMAA